MKKDVKFIREMLANNPKFLLEVFNDFIQGNKGTIENIPKNREEVVLVKMARDHVHFISKYGGDVEKIREGDHFYSAQPEYFEEWLQRGFPGIDIDAI